MATFSFTSTIGGGAKDKYIMTGGGVRENPYYQETPSATQQAAENIQVQKAYGQSQLEIDSSKMALANQYREKEGATQRDIDKAQTERTKISDSGATERNRQSLETQRGMVGLNQQANNQTKNEDADRARGALAAFSRGF
jgi:hypothetical protein